MKLLRRNGYLAWVGAARRPDHEAWYGTHILQQEIHVQTPALHLAQVEAPLYSRSQQLVILGIRHLAPTLVVRRLVSRRLVWVEHDPLVGKLGSLPKYLLRTGRRLGRMQQPGLAKVLHL